MRKKDCSVATVQCVYSLAHNENMFCYTGKLKLMSFFGRARESMRITCGVPGIYCSLVDAISSSRHVLCAVHINGVDYSIFSEISPVCGRPSPSLSLAHTARR